MTAAEAVRHTARQFLIRIRPATVSTAQPGASVDFDLEVLVDGAIFPCPRITVDLNSLNQLLRKDKNEYGATLGELLCSARQFADALALVSDSPAIRVQIMLEGEGPHHAIRWERLQFPQWPITPIAFTPTTPFSRFCAVNQPLAPIEDKGVFTLLLVIANPDPALKLPPIDADKACLTMMKSCEKLLDSRQMRLSIMPGDRGAISPATQEALEKSGVSMLSGRSTTDAIKKQLDGVVAMHVIAHGSFQNNRFFLMLEDDAPCDAEQIVRLLAPTRLRLVCFESCQTATDSDSGIAGLLNQLVRAGVPAALGMQDLITMDDASKFRAGFYESLVQEGNVDRAVNSGRNRLADSPNFSWSTPVLATRLPDGELWSESQLRAALRRLAETLSTAHKAANPALPIETVSIAINAIGSQQNLAPDDSLDKLQVDDAHREDVLTAIEKAIASEDKGTLCLIGPPGRSKTRILEEAFLQQWDRHCEGSQSAIPVMLRLAECSDSQYDATDTICRGVATFLQDRTGVTVDPSVIAEQMAQKQKFLFFVSGDEDLGQTTLMGALKAWSVFLASPSGAGDRCIVTLDQNSLTLADVPEEACCLMVQPMRLERVRTYLDIEEIQPAGEELCRALMKSRIFDLAEVPWLLNEMLSQAERGVLGSNRASIIRRIIDEKLARYPAPPSFRTRAAEALYLVGWEMQERRVQSLHGRDVFDILAGLRGNRDYNMVEFREQLIEAGVLSPSGEDGLRFSYPGFRTYCSARYLLGRSDSERRALLENMTASLGRKARADWWCETLFLLAGLWNQTPDLLRLILSGSPLHEGEQLYIAARCLQEAREAFPESTPDTALEDSIINGLIYTSHPLSLRSVSARKKVLEFLGPLIEPAGSPHAGRGSNAAISHLVSLVLSKIRPDDDGKVQYDFSGIRLAAVKAMLCAPNEVENYLAADSEFSRDQDLLEVVKAWFRMKPSPLIYALECNSGERSATVAAFALGLMNHGAAFDALAGRFDAEDSSKDLLWALTETIALVGRERIRGFIAERLKNSKRIAHLIYLIGKSGPYEPNSAQWRVLQDHLEGPDEYLAGRALFALSQLGDKSQRQRCYDWLDSTSFQHRYYALQSLRNIGDQTTLDEIAQLAWQSDAAAAGNSFLFLQQLRLEVYEEIYWRLAGGLSREVMLRTESRPMVQKRGT